MRWVSGLNHQFAKLTYGILYRGFESPSHRRKGTTVICGVFLCLWTEIPVRDSSLPTAEQTPRSTLIQKVTEVSVFLYIFLYFKDCSDVLTVILDRGVKTDSARRGYDIVTAQLPHKDQSI